MGEEMYINICNTKNHDEGTIEEKQVIWRLRP